MFILICFNSNMAHQHTSIYQTVGLDRLMFFERPWLAAVAGRWWQTVPSKIARERNGTPSLCLEDGMGSTVRMGLADGFRYVPMISNYELY
jgi:hypothetical protein